MQTFKFLVQGSQPEPYESVFYFDGHNMTATCTCAAGENGQYCKHRISILEGDDSKIVSSKNEVPELLKAFKISPLYAQLEELNKEEKELNKMTEKFKASKKVFAKIMYGH